MRMLSILLTASLGLASSVLSMAHAAPPSIEQLAAFPEYSSFTLSPDGRHMAALRANGEERVIAVWRTDAMNVAPTQIGSQRMKIAGVSFIKNDRLAVTMWQPVDLRFDGVTKTFISKLFITDLQGKAWKEPLSPSRATTRAQEMIQAMSSPSVLSSLPNDPKHILMVNNVGANAGDIYRVNLENFKAERIQMSTPDAAGYTIDLDGNLRSRQRTGLDGTGAYITVEFRNPQTNDWDEHFRSYVKDRNEFGVIGFSTDPNIAFITSNKDQERSAIYEYDIATRQMKEVLYQHAFFNANRVIINPYRASGEGFGQLLGVGYEGPYGDEIEWTAPSMRALDAGLRQALNITGAPLRVVDPATGKSAQIEHPSQRNYHITDYSEDFKTVTLTVSGPSTAPEHYLFKDGKLTLLTKTFADIPASAYGDTRLVYYKARDGLDIPAFLTTPDTATCGAGPWRAVVHPHGGPWARDSLDFDGSMWTPLMASRCMTVLRPQFRGSAGWGRKLWMAGDAEWGQKMQDDKDDGAKWLIEQNIAKPGHIAMFGFSYGGYSAFTAAVRPEGMYKCAIAGAGVSDIKKIWARFYTNPFFRQAQAPTVDGLNPLDHAEKIRIPLMVYHGDRDQTVPIEQSEWFANKAKSSGQPVEYHAIADYAHGPAWTRAIMADQLRLIDTYFASGCGGTGL
ncbi:MAG: prolyl oligopeptidase family serine peptidase [Stenotrophomonas sp.]